MRRLHLELQNLSQNYIVGEQLEMLKDVIKHVKDFSSIPASYRILRKRSTNQLLTLRCGPHQVRRGPLRDTRQDASFVPVVACKALEERVAEFLQELEETWEPSEISYPLLWELRQSQTEAVLNSLPEMAKSPSQLMLNMKDDCTMPTSGAGLTPFGRCKANTQLFGSSANYSMQMLACLEMPKHNAVDVLTARDNGELMNMVMQSRRR